MNIPIIYEDPNFLVINKPSGIAVHKVSSEDPQITVVDIITEQFPDIKKVGENPLRPGIVHRLDKETSGLMIIAKTQDAFIYLKNLFQSRKIKKTYLALVQGTMKQLQGNIEIPLGKIGIRQTTRIKGRRDLKERVALTHYSTLKQYINYSLLQVQPETGRTHQIRVHLKSIGHPIAGDPIYGPKNSPRPPGLNRLFLHAQKLQFISPEGKSFLFEADLPDDLQKVLSGLE
ncbi:MAG TPA: RluA family pseudouridine synthase [Candidatus Paceibacterota bacterium]|nr:RluA family pseudouridine synthase [Candidatus Paceibacterota bacterium]